MLMSVKALVGISSFFWLLLLLRRMMKYVKDQFVSSFYRFFPVFFSFILPLLLGTMPFISSLEINGTKKIFKNVFLSAVRIATLINLSFECTRAKIRTKTLKMNEMKQMEPFGRKKVHFCHIFPSFYFFQRRRATEPKKLYDVNSNEKPCTT